MSAPPAGADDAPSVEVSFAYLGEAWRSAGGGVATGQRYLDDLTVSVDLDGERLMGAEGLGLHASVVHNNGHSISALTGVAQGNSGIEAAAATRLYEAWADWRYAPGQSIRVGLYELNSEFDSIDTAGLFAAAAHGMGSDFAQTGLNGPASFPVPGLGLRWRAEYASGFALQAAVLEGTPGDPDEPGETRWDLDGDEGLLLAGELQYAGGRINKAALGYWRYTARFARVDAGPSTPPQHGNAGAYAFIDLRLAGGESGSTLDGWLRAGVAAGEFNRADRYLGAGLAWGGAFGRSEDSLGIAVAHARNGEEFRHAQALAGTPRGATETVLEMTWRAVLTDWLALQPVVQYTFDPDTDPALADSLAVGLRFELGWSRGW